MTRDARHLALPQVGANGQQRIADGSVLLIGVGGIGCAAAAYLASSGVGHITVCDFDTVDETNLGRQVLYAQGHIGELKAEVAATRLRKINPAIQVEAISERLIGDALVAAVAAADVVLDGCDNFATRFQVNDACVAESRRLISGSAIRLEGQLAVFGPDYSESPCYRCLYADADESLGDCAGNGVLAPVPGVVGTLMAVECLKFLAGIAPPAPLLRLYDGTASEFRHLGVSKRPDCPACA
ncbi:MAG: HesA/MoeB/ThiF family protein [Gammaproteobacteria bacterium]|jgi:adenylyltransferase/sulfurtransferase|nr:HesA/MoeB/ThiF family protein [Gammaproteobacteria bacterium]MDH3812664.1 HesA/MoeB/ThiF family protein [Gammaproteobacteria bacterium]